MGSPGRSEKNGQSAKGARDVVKVMALRGRACPAGGVDDYTGPVLLYDGECGLCRALTRRLVRWDRRGSLRFAPLQGPFAQATLRRLGLPTADFDSLVFLPVARGLDYSLRTDGVLAVLAVLGGGWRRLAGILGVVPAAWRDAIYRLVARLRYRVFGRVDFNPREPVDPTHADRFIH